MGLDGRALTKLDPVFARKAANDGRLREAEVAHESALIDEHRALETRLLPKLARGTFAPDIWLPGNPPVRRHIIEALEEHPRLLLVGGRWSGKSALAGFVLARCARWDPRFGQHTAFGVHVSRMSGPTLDEAEIARLNPAAGPELLQLALEAGRSLVVVDGLDEADPPGTLKRSIEALAARYPLARFIATTRPLMAKLAGRSESAMEGFTTVRLAGPDTSKGAKILELDVARSPAERVERLGQDVQRLFDAWSLDRLPPGSALGRLTERGRVLFTCRVAARAYDGRMIELSADDLAEDICAECEGARWFPDTEQILHKEENPTGGEPIPDPEGFARRVVEDIRRTPGVLAERPGGLFAFADLQVHQYLTAMYFSKEDLLTTELVIIRDDPWWQPVIVLAAGLHAPFSSRLPARALIGELLEQSAGADSIATFLASNAAQVARSLPQAMRDDIERRMRSALPPRSSVQVAHLVDDIGDIAAPALLAALDGAGPNERAFILTALGRLDHPPALRAIARHAGDDELTTEPILCWAWNVDAMLVNQPVGFYAFVAFFNLALVSPAAYAMFDQVLGRTSYRILETFMRLVAYKIIEDEHWGVEQEYERDPDHAGALMDKVGQAYARRAPR